LAVYSPPPGTQKETIPHPRDSSSTTNTLFCVQNIDYDIDFSSIEKTDVLKRKTEEKPLTKLAYG